MAFEGLSDKLSNLFSKLKNKGKLTPEDIKIAMREIRLALLEADVSYKVVKDFVEKVSVRANGEEVLESLTPSQQVIKIVNDELVSIMGSVNSKIVISPKPPTIIMMVGLQGSGKTTNAAKLANYFRKQGKRPLLVACDVYRPAAIKQLCVVGGQVNVPVFEQGQGNPVEIAKNAVAQAIKNQNDMVFIDTAGRLHIDEVLMGELKNIKSSVKPTEIMLVVDAMTGQDAVNVAETFNNELGIDSVLLTKFDGDTRGGAALSVKSVTNKPIKFTGIGEKLDAIEPFYPDRIASRILGMGDVLSLIEKAQQTFDEKKATELEQKMRQNRLTLQDFLYQMQEIKKMGSIKDLISMIPGIDKKTLANANVDEKQMSHIEAIILSMTKRERDNPQILNASRKKRIAAGSGTKVEDINRLLKQFEQMQQMVKQMSGNKGNKFMKKVKRNSGSFLN